MYLEKSTSFKQVQTEDLADLVNPLVGSDSTYEFSHGNTYPSVALPFAMIQWTPQTDSSSWIYQYHATKIQGFRGTHSPSVWMGEYSSFTIIRPSGNAPQLRIYAVANTQTRANDIVEMSLREPDGLLRKLEAEVKK